MTAHDDLLDELAIRLDAAESASGTIPPILADYPELDIDDAYQIQLRNVRRKVARGERISGKKIGLTSRAMQEQLGVRQPDYGHLFAHLAVPTGGIVPRCALVAPRVEAELAFVLKDDLPTSGVTPSDALRATDYVVAALEIVDSRIADWKITLVDTIADNASFGRYVLGQTRIDPHEIDLRLIGMELFANGQFVATGKGAAVLDDPANAVAWLANAVGEYGVSLQAGEVVLSGAMAAMTPAEAGYTISAHFDTINEEVSVTFE